MLALESEVLLAALPLAVVGIADDGRIQFANDRARAVLGESLCPGGIWSELPQIRRFGLQDLAAGRTHRINLHGIGSAHHLWQVAVGRWQNGFIVSLVETAFDAESAFPSAAFHAEPQQAPDIFRQVVEQSPSMVVITDRDGCIEYVNPRFCEVSGFAQEELLGRNPRMLKSGENSESIYRGMWDCLSAGQTWRGELRNRRKQGDIYRVTITIVPLRDPSGNIARFLSVQEDITARRAAEDLATRSLDELDRVVANLPGGVMRTDAAGTVTFINQGFRDLYYFPDDLAQAGASIADIYRFMARRGDLGTGDLDECVSRAMAVYSSGRFNEQERCFPDGRVVYVRRIPTPDGGVLSFSENITERKRVESELLAAREVADAANRAKSDFLANMSHEIRTPMNAVIGLGHLLMATELNHKQRDYLAKIQRSAENLLEIINDILDFSKIEAGKLELEQIEFDVSEVLENVTTVTSMRAAEKGLELLVDAAPDLPNRLIGDPLRLGQILINLTNNAVKFTEHGEITLRIRLQQSFTDAIELAFEVIDTGIGMTETQQQRLFQAFSQADSSTTRKYGGSGLGLVICARLVNLMHGQISVRSTSGQGSCFSFTARLQVAQTPTQNFPSALAERLADMRVLVVDDNAASREILGSYLESFGCEVTLAASAAEALGELEVAGSRPFRLVLMDWKMPGMDGITAARRIKSQHVAEIPTVVMVTAYSRDQVSREAEAAGLDGLLIKPVTPSVLLNKLGELTLGKPKLPPPSQHPLQQAEQVGLTGLQVLLVEDNPINQLVARDILEKAGVRVSLAENGQEAVDAIFLTKNLPDLVLMDIQMPIMDGYEATRQIRARFPRLPIVAMTANAMAADRERALNSGMDEHVAKPFDIQRLFSVIARLTRSPLPPPIAAETPSAADIELGPTQRLVNNPQKFAELLQLFVDRFSPLLNDLPKLSGTVGGVLRDRAHDLKGTAANLGFRRVSAVASQLEEAAKRGDTAAQIEAAAMLVTVLSEAIQVSKAEILTTPKAAVATTATAQTLSQLIQLLQRNDLAACDTVGAVIARLQDQVPAADLEALQRAIQQLDFRSAENTARRIAAAHPTLE